jgi:hypothetical protein
MPTNGIRGEARSPVPRDHHRGFDLALEDAVRRFAEEHGPTDGPVELSVMLGGRDRPTTPGRIVG